MSTATKNDRDGLDAVAEIAKASGKKARGKAAPQSNGDGVGLRQAISIAAPNFLTASFLIRGDSPFVQLRFTEKARNQMKMKHLAGSTSKKGTKREPRDFQEDFRQSMYRLPEEGGYGIPSASFRNAMISACRLCGFKMTIAKLSLFIEPNGFDVQDHTPLTKITKGEPQYHESVCRNANGSADLRVRAMWQPGWEATVTVKFDSEMLTVTDVSNLLMRVGGQVGVGEGRADSKNSAGQGWGSFQLVQQD
jgi:hypothetical protein